MIVRCGGLVTLPDTSNLVWQLSLGMPSEDEHHTGEGFRETCLNVYATDLCVDF